MKNLVFVFAVVLACSATAMAFDIAISTQAGWFGQAAADREMQEIVDNVTAVSIEVFPQADQDALAGWVRDHTGDGASDLLILCGQIPDTIYAPGNSQTDDSLAELFLDDGNCIVNTGDYMFYVVNGAGTNAEGGIRTIMDIPGITMWDDDTAVVVTPEGRDYTPTLQDFQTDRPFHLDQLEGDWEPELILAQNAAGTRADPVIVVNTETGGRLGIFYQTSGQDNDPRGEVISEWINNWYIPEVGSSNPYARGPSPKDGTMIEQTTAFLTWKAGDFADVHNVYFGDDADAVEAATPEDADLFAGTVSMEMLIVGIGADALTPGKTYYWRVDEVNDANAASPWKGRVWSFDIRPLTAFQPFPADGMSKVDPDQDLTWEAGIGTIFHQVAFGTSFDEVNDIPTPVYMTVDAIYDPGTLELDTTYYWRVDEFKGTTTDRGEVWSFTTRGEGGGVEAEYFDGMALAGNPILAQIEPSINGNWGSGEVAGGLSDLVSARWRGNIEAPFTEPVDLITTTDDGVRLYVDGRLVIDNWTDHGTTDDRATIDMEAGQYHLIVMEWYENGGGAVAQLSWESDSMPRQIIPQGWLQLPQRATSPTPADNESAAPQDAVLSWMAGDDATGHQVYFGDDADAVASADTSTAGIYRGQQTADATTFNPGPLEWGKEYFWRVDEVNADGVLAGAVWSFTVANFIVIDDFESYDNEVGSRPFEVWIDGVGFTLPAPGHPGNGSNALVGNDIWTPGTPYTLLMETQDVHGGAQSMPVAYGNDLSPFYSEIERTWVAPQNWTVNGVDTLTLHVSGGASNTADRFYVTLTDSSGRSATVEVADASFLTSREWSVVSIPLADFAGVNAAAIKTIVIGLGNPPAAGGVGSLLFDDFRVTVGE
jgi:hypothetical protein